MSGVRPGMAVLLATVGFFALLVGGFGILSLLLDADVISTPGIGLLAGALAAAAAVAGFALVLWRATRAPRPSYSAAGLATLVAVVAYLALLWIGALVQGAGLALATAAVGGFVTSWFVVLLAGCAFVAGWCGVALVRTEARRPRWPWERDEDVP